MFGLNNPLDAVRRSQVYYSRLVSNMTPISLVDKADEFVFGGGEDRSVFLGPLVCFCMQHLELSDR
jgi:hypothetical protein